MCEGVQFSVGSDIEKSAGGVIRASSESITIGEEAADIGEESRIRGKRSRLLTKLR